jgi:hypothetical protein
MGSNGANPDEEDDQARESAAKRWTVDAEGRTVYSPYGPGFAGVLVVEPARERALRAAVRRYDDLSRQLRPWAFVFVLPFGWALHNWLASHPVRVAAVLAGSIVAAVLVDWVLRRVLVGPLLAGLPRIAAQDTLAATRRRRAGLIALALIGGIWLVLHLYDVRVAPTTADGDRIDFYPDLSQNLLFAVLFALVIWIIVAGWRNMQAKFGETRMAITMVVLVGIELVFAFGAVGTFFKPEPKIVISRDDLTCGRRYRWTAIVDLKLVDGRMGKKYVRAEPADSRVAVENCEITGLNADDDAVYDAMQAAWQAAPAAAARDRPGEETASHPMSAVGPERDAWLECLTRQAEQLGPQPCGALNSKVDLVHRQCSREEDALKKAMLPKFSGIQENVDLVIKMTRVALTPALIPREPGSRCR